MILTLLLIIIGIVFLATFSIIGVIFFGLFLLVAGFLGLLGGILLGPIGIGILVFFIICIIIGALSN
ncbi:MAG: hypothetical protein ACTTIS_06190 [Streptobacillus sp.]